ncbi:MAG: prolipoprotein diacylglyceryl transferase [Planctomycetota bacterium]
MHPELLTLPGGFTIKTYGFCMMLGFLSAVWFAMRRAERVKADPDVVLDISFLCLFFGVGGARAFYVIHYWKTQFADAPNRLMAIVDITNGGLEFLGGFLGAVLATVVYGRLKKRSLRLYLDIMAPGAMWGLAFGRVGCFFNGCCFGGLAVAATGEAVHPWAVRFPCSSPAHVRHWEDRQVTLPAELVTVTKEMLQPWPLPDRLLEMSVERREGPEREAQNLREALTSAKASNVGSASIQQLTEAAAAAEKRLESHRSEISSLFAAQRFPSRVNAARPTSVSELQKQAAKCLSQPVHPTQLYAAGQAMFLSLLLSAVFTHRRRHGMVIGLLLLLYPVQRTLEEIIRADNPHDVGGLTASQSISVGLLVLATAYLVYLYKILPERSPLVAREARADEH